jgi:predicted small lipoprotein YifL
VALRDRSILLKVAVAGAIVAALALSGCGRKGALEPPPGAAATDQRKDPAEVPETGESDQGQKKTAPDKPFALDFLI